MKLFKLLKGIKSRVLGRVNIEIKSLHFKDYEVEKGGLYFCINGTKEDGSSYAYSAVKNGAVVVVLEKELSGFAGVVQIIVKDVRKTMSLMARNFYGEPDRDLKLIGVTGTNGKTTTTHMISDLLKNLGYSSAVIGTNGVFFNDKIIETGMTTPDPIELYRILKTLSGQGVQYVCMEVSAHALQLKKIEGLIFEVVIFSNLTEDHLDFFDNMNSYFEAKKKLFSKKFAKTALINIDDEYGKILNEGIKLEKKTYSIYNNSDYPAKDLGVENFEQLFEFQGKVLKSKFLGEFNIYNLLSAIACVDMLNLKIRNIQKMIDDINFVSGRFNSIVIKEKLFIVDYAHTPDGLENVLRLCKSILKNGKLFCLFGCGGDRETQKRPKMAEISSKYANFTIITTDNPRFESRLSIAHDIESGMKNDNYKIILDRSEAIEFADKISNEGDIILIAGKGAENYIDEQGEKKYYRDFDELEKIRKKIWLTI